MVTCSGFKTALTCYSAPQPLIVCLSLQRTSANSNPSGRWQGSFQELLGAPPGPNSPPHRQRSGPPSDRAAFQQRPNRQYDEFRQRPERNMHDTNLPGRVLDDNSRPVGTLSVSCGVCRCSGLLSWCETATLQCTNISAVYCFTHWVVWQGSFADHVHAVIGHMWPEAGIFLTLP